MTEPNFAGLSISLQLPLERLQQFKPDQLRAIFAGIADMVPLAGSTGRVQALSSTALSPAQPKRIGVPRPNTWANDARKDVLRRMYPSEDPFYTTQQIHEAVAACDGPQIPRWSTVTVYAIQTLRLKRGKAPPSTKPPRERKRPQNRRGGFKPSEPIEVFEAPTAAPGVELPPVEAAWETIQRQALRQGFELRAQSDLPMYNRARIRRGESPFCIHRARAA